jgi:HlyD family secretion protein
MSNDSNEEKSGFGSAETESSEVHSGAAAGGNAESGMEPESVSDDGVGQSVSKKKKADTETSSSGTAASANDKKNKPKKQTGRRIMVLIIIVFLALAAYFAAQYFKKKKTATTTTTTGSTATAAKQNISSTISASGTIAAKNTYSVTSLVSGTIVGADFEEGDQVTKGQVLYQIDASSMDSELTSAQNTLTRAQESYDDAVKKLNDAQSKYSSRLYKATQSGYIKKVYIVDGQKISSNANLLDLYNDATMKIRIPFLSGEAAMIEAGSDATLTISDTLEQINGVVTSVATQEETLTGGRLVHYVTIQVENPGGLTTSTNAAATINGFASVEEGTFEASSETTMASDLDASVVIEKVLVNLGDYVTVGTPIFSISADTYNSMIKTFSDAVDTKQASIESAQQKLDSTSDTIGNYTITAPIDGQVIKKTYKVGEKIGSSSGSSSSTTALATIYDMSQYTFSMSVDETDISNVKVGQTVTITADAFSGVTFTGKVTNISLVSTVSNGVSTYPVTVTLDSTDKLLPGMNVDGEIIVASASDAICIPANALQRGNKVYVKDDTVKTANGLVPAGFRSVAVKTGLIDADYVQITEGISEGDQVYVSASSKTSTTQAMMGPGGSGGGGGQGGPPPG